MQQNSRNWKLGLGLALTTAAFWGILPIALKVALTELDAWTITWCRFAAAMLTVGTWLGVHGELPGGYCATARSGAGCCLERWDSQATMFCIVSACTTHRRPSRRR